MLPSKELGLFLKNRRVGADLTQRQVSETLGYTTPQFISNQERGISAPPVDAMKKLIDLYGIQGVDLKNVIRNSYENKAKNTITSLGL